METHENKFRKVESEMVTNRPVVKWVEIALKLLDVWWGTDLFKALCVIGKYKHFIDKVEEGKSLMNIKNNKGPKMLPWGTPKITDKQLDGQLLTDTHWVLLLK